MRTGFIANVSHELRTPSKAVPSILASVETIKNSAKGEKINWKAFSIKIFADSMENQAIMRMTMACIFKKKIY